MSNTSTLDKQLGTQIPLVYNKDLSFYIQWFIQMELLKNNNCYAIHLDILLEKFNFWLLGTRIDAFTKYQFINALMAVNTDDKITVVKKFDLYKISKTI